MYCCDNYQEEGAPILASWSQGFFLGVIDAGSLVMIVIFEGDTPVVGWARMVWFGTCSDTIGYVRYIGMVI